MRRAYLPVLLAAGLAACATSPRPFNEPLLSVPELLTNADRYHGKTIFVEGFASAGTKANALCPDPVPSSPKECLALLIDFGPSESARVQWQALDGRPVEVKGTFNKANAALEQVSGAWLEDWK
jgi:hypothetical protein